MRRLHPSVLLVALTVGCSTQAHDEDLATSEAALVFGPVSGDSVDGAIPSLGVSGRMSEAALDKLTADAVHEGVFSNGADVASPAAVSPLGAADAPWDDAPFFAWRAAVAGSSPSTTVPAALDAQLHAASDSLPSDLAKLDQKKLEDLLGPIKSFLPNFHARPSDRRLLRYTPLRARWLRSQYARPTTSAGGLLLFTPETKYTYADPKAFTELRQRGARTYCAAREAASRQAAGNVAMGEMVGFSVSILGKTIDFGVLEPTISIEEPKVFAAKTGDGAQAFKIPFLAGTRITPIRGLGLPSLPEVRSPLVLLGADGEVSNLTDKRRITLPGPTICTPFFGCRSRGTSIANAHSKEYVTAAHADAIATATGGVTADVTTPIYSVGILRVDLTVFGELYFGRIDPKNERLLDGTPGWAPSRPRGVSFVSPWAGYKYDESPIRFDDVTRYTAPVDSFVMTKRLTGDTSTAFGPVLADGMLTRALNDDDHVVASGSGLKIGAKLTGTASVEEGPVKIILTAGGTLSGDVSLKHEVRDSLQALAPTTDSSETSFVAPLTSLDISPRTRAEGALEQMFAHIFFDMDLGFFGHVTIDEDLFRFEKVLLAAWDSGRWGEETHLRIGTGSGYGADPMKHPDATMGHWPSPVSSLSSAAFETIPAGVDVCLATPKPVAPPPPACPPRMDGGKPASAEICVFSGANAYEVGDPRFWTSPGFGSVGFWTEACASPSAAAAKYFGTDPAIRACMADLAAYVCAPVSKTQTWQGRAGIARVLQTGDAAMLTRLSEVSKQCATAFIGTAGSPTEANAAAQSLIRRLIQFGTCDKSAAMLSDKEVLSASADPTKPPVLSPKDPSKPCE